MEEFFNKTDIEINHLLKNKNNINSIDLIFNNVHKIERVLRGLLIRKKYLSHIFPKDSYEDLIIKINNILLNLQIILADLHSDLAIRLDEQKESLKSATSEVIENIH